MLLIRSRDQTSVANSVNASPNHSKAEVEQEEPRAAPQAPTLEQTVRALHSVGSSQRAIARELSIDRRKVKQIIDRGAA
jgi:hypothetical protein